MRYLIIIAILLVSSCSIKPKKIGLSYKQKERILDNINNTDRAKLEKLLNKI